MRHAVALAVAVLIVSSCGVPTRREVQGQLAGMSLEQALVLSETTQGQVAVAQVDSRSGAFVVEVPVDTPTRLVIARSNGPGSAIAERHIGPAWFTVPGGGRVDLGVVRPAGTERPLVEPVGSVAPSCPSGTTTTTTVNTPGSAELPYDVKLSVGDSFKLTDAFLEKGPLPKQVIEVKMDGSSWRLAELRANTVFTVTAADCSHQGNRDVGRDRAFITWENADGSRETDHLDLRYCASGSVTQPLEDGSVDSSSSLDDSGHAACGPVEVEGCGDDKADCDHEDTLTPVGTGATCGGSGGVNEIPGSGAGGGSGGSVPPPLG
jgi:hypothetical protein